MIVVPLIALVVGVVSGLLGLGGGELLAPVLLQLGMLPQVASATSGFMILFTSSSNVVHYLADGSLDAHLGYVLWALALGFCAALLGRGAAIMLVQKLSHPSLIAFLIGGTLMVALFLLLLQMATEAPDFALKSMC